VQFIEQFPAARIGERLEHLVHCRQYMQPFGCMSSRANDPNVGIALRNFHQSLYALRAVCRR
jgi:hypothetical protein